MNKPIVEKTFIVNGFECAILLMPLGHRCAYINVKDTTLENVDYNDIDLDVHGGLTYASSKLYNCKNGWWIGWDYAHYMDGIDYPALIVNTTDEYEAKHLVHRIKMDAEFRMSLHVWTIEEVMHEVQEAVVKLQEYLNEN